MNFEEIFRACWENLLTALPHDRQAVVLTIPGGLEARELAGRAVDAADAVIENWFATANRN